MPREPGVVSKVGAGDVNAVRVRLGTGPATGLSCLSPRSPTRANNACLSRHEGRRPNNIDSLALLLGRMFSQGPC